MVHRHNHYEAAFEAYLRAQRIPYVAVDESRRSLLAEGTLKNLDFIVSPQRAGAVGNAAPTCRWLVDVKGRRFAAGKRRSLWSNWSTRDDLTSLARWEELFGPPFYGLLVFAYLVEGDLAPLPADRLFAHSERLYGFVAISLDLYAAWAKQRSPKWNTVGMPTVRFRELAQPADEFFQAAASWNAAAPF